MGNPSQVLLATSAGVLLSTVVITSGFSFSAVAVRASTAVVSLTLMESVPLGLFNPDFIGTLRATVIPLG